METLSLTFYGLKRIGAFCSQNTSNTSSKKECEKDGADKIVYDEGDDAIASHQKYMFLVLSHLGQEEGQKTMVNNLSIAAPANVTHNTKE